MRRYHNQCLSQKQNRQGRCQCFDRHRNYVAELNGNSNNARVRSYAWGLDASGSTSGAGGVGGLLMVDDSTNGVHFVSYDLNGNVMGLVKATDGTVSATYEHGPFGEQLSSTGSMASSNPFRFSTKYTDTESDLVYYGYRYYSISLGRWISRDPIEEQGGLNLYCFVGNDPVNRIDWLGLGLYDKINDLFYSRLKTPVVNVFRSNQYNLIDSENEMSKIYDILDYFYGYYLCKNTKDSDCGWKQKMIPRVNVVDYVGIVYYGSGKLADYLGGSHRVFLSGNLEYCRGANKKLKYKRTQMEGEWIDDIDANSFPGIAWLKGEHKNVFDNFSSNNGWWNYGKDLGMAFLEGTWDIVGDGILDTDFEVNIHFTDKRDNERSFDCSR